VKRGRASYRDQKATLDRLLAALGKDTSIAALTAERSPTTAGRKAEPSLRRHGVDGKPLKVWPATVNRELALWRHLVLAQEWGHAEPVPRIRLEREPEGRVRFLSEEEIGRLLWPAARRANQQAPPDDVSSSSPNVFSRAACVRTGDRALGHFRRRQLARGSLATARAELEE
jgi:hypothetical protein